jgi:hypothetical protein
MLVMMNKRMGDIITNLYDVLGSVAEGINTVPPDWRSRLKLSATNDVPIIFIQLSLIPFSHHIKYTAARKVWNWRARLKQGACADRINKTPRGGFASRVRAEGGGALRHTSPALASVNMGLAERTELSECQARSAPSFAQLVAFQTPP